MLISVARLREIYLECMSKVGVDSEEAAITTKCLMNADLMGNRAQGIYRLPILCKEVEEGYVIPGAPIEVAVKGNCFAIINGNDAIGQVIATKAMSEALKMAKAEGVGCVVVQNGNDIGMLANYTMQAIEHNCLAIAMTNGYPMVAPVGGREPVFSTNPISFASPAHNKKPIVLDMATSTSASGIISQMAMANLGQIPEGWAINKSGEPTVDPNEALKGAILPFGGHKGYGLQIMVDVFSGVLAGLSMTREAKRNRPWNKGQFFLALDIEKYLDIDTFMILVDELISDIKSSQLLPGVKEILLPGERELRNIDSSEEKGVELPDYLWKYLNDYLKELGIST